MGLMGHKREVHQPTREWCTALWAGGRIGLGKGRHPLSFSYSLSFPLSPSGRKKKRVGPNPTRTGVLVGLPSPWRAPCWRASSSEALSGSKRASESSPGSGADLAFEAEHRSKLVADRAAHGPVLAGEEWEAGSDRSVARSGTAFPRSGAGSGFGPDPWEAVAASMAGGSSSSASLFTRSVMLHPATNSLVTLLARLIVMSITERAQRYLSDTRSDKSYSQSMPTQQTPSETPVEHLYNHPVML